MRFRRKLKCPKKNQCKRPKILLTPETSLLRLVNAPLPNAVTTTSEDILETTFPEEGMGWGTKLAIGTALTGAALVFAQGAYFRHAQSLINRAQAHSSSRLPFPNLGVFDEDNRPSAPPIATMNGRMVPYTRWTRQGQRLVRQVGQIALFGGAHAIASTVKSEWDRMTVPVNIPMGNSPFQPSRETGGGKHSFDTTPNQRDQGEGFGTKLIRHAKDMATEMGGIFMDGYKMGTQLFHKIMGSSNMIDDISVQTNKLKDWSAEAWNVAQGIGGEAYTRGKQFGAEAYTRVRQNTQFQLDNIGRNFGHQSWRTTDLTSLQEDNRDTNYMRDQ